MGAPAESGEHAGPPEFLAKSRHYETDERDVQKQIHRAVDDGVRIDQMLDLGAVVLHQFRGFFLKCFD
jgi:hypothetical protein